MNSVRAKLLYTGKSVLKDTYIHFEGKKIKGVGKTKKGRLVGSFPTVTPAFIDPHTHIGMVRGGEPEREEESNEKMDSILPLVDALDSVQMDDVAFEEAVEMGVLYSGVLPGSGNIISGHAAVIRNYAEDTNQALISRAGVKAAFGYNPMSTAAWKGDRPYTRMGAASILRSKLHAVRQKMEKEKGKKSKKGRDEVSFSAEETVLRELLTGKNRLRTHVHKIDDVAALLRIVDEFGLKTTVEHAMDVHEPGIFEELRRRRILVTYGPLDSFAYKVELKHESWRNVEHLVESGVQFGLMTDHPVTPARQLFLQTRWFTRFGLSRQEAIELVSRRNAEILGITDVLGSVEKGKWASFTCWNGDPFDFTSYPTLVIGEGSVLYED
jgi:imidazolonepropionase-like amidohydrolase